MSDATQPPAKPSAFPAEDARDLIDDLVFDDPDQYAFNPAAAGLEWDANDEDTEEWIEAACDKITEYGARAFLRRMLEELHAMLAEESDDEMADTLADHLLNKRVLAWRGSAPTLPIPKPFDALLVFEDGHALPIELPANIQDVPSAKRLNALVDQYLVGVFVQQDANDLPYLVLAFHHKTPNPDVPLTWDDVQARGFTRVPTNMTSGRMMLCPDALSDELKEATGLVTPEVDAVKNHLNKTRVAYKQIANGVGTLVFDDGHILPLLPVPGMASIDADTLESVVGRFLVLAALDDNPRRLIIYFHDVADRIDAILEQTELNHSEKAFQLLAEFGKEPATRILTVAPESARHIICPGQDEAQEETLWH